MAHSKVPSERLQSSQNPNAKMEDYGFALTQSKPHQPQIEQCLYSVPTYSMSGLLTPVLLHSLPIYPSISLQQQRRVAMKLLLLLLLAMPEGLSGTSEVDLPVSSALLSLPFYLLCLLLSSVHMLVCTSAESACYFCSLSWGLVFGAVVLSSALLCILVSMATRRGAKPPGKSPSRVGGSGWSLSELNVLLLVGTAGHTLSLSASSFVEEEHQVWYFLLNTLCLVVFQDVCRKYFRERCANIRVVGCSEDEDYLLPSKEGDTVTSPLIDLGLTGAGSERWLALATPLLTLACCRLLRSLNQTGVQWVHLPDLGHWLNSSEHKTVLSLLASTSLALIYFLVQRRCSWVSKIALALGLLGVYSYRAAVGNVMLPWQHSGGNMSKGTVKARFVYVFVLGILFSGSKDLLRSQVIPGDARLKIRGLWELYSGVVLLVALLFRAHNLPVLCCCLLVQTLMAQFIWKKLHYDAAQTTIMHYWFGQAFFFFQGNSNSIATVDISVGFVGLESYVEAPAVFLTALSTYAGPLLWAAHLVCYLSSENRSSVAVGHGCYCLALLRSVPAAAYVVLVTALRYHLFIWSVFSPKLLYESMHTLLTAAICLFFTTMEQSRSSSRP